MKAKKTGFSLVELSISVVFIGILSLAIVFTINNTVMAYRRGNTLNQINTVGMDLVDDMRIAIQNTSARTLTGICAKLFNDYKDEIIGVDSNGRDIYTRVENKWRKYCENDNAYNFVSVTKYSTVVLNQGTSNEKTRNNLPIYGVFCTGTYSYIWNSGYFYSTEASFNEKESGWVKLKYKGGEITEKFKLVKIPDESRAACIVAVYPDYMATDNDLNYINRQTVTDDLFKNNVIDITRVSDEALADDPVFLLASGGDNDLVLYDLLVSRPAISTENNSVFYPVSFVLGTIDGGIDITSQGRTCAAPNDYNGNLDYCAVNRFSFAVRTTGGDR